MDIGYILFAFGYLISISQVQSTGEISLLLVSLTIEGGKLPNGSCCDSFPFATWCSSACDPFFEVCVTSPAKPIACGFGLAVTGHEHNTNDIQFKHDIGGTPNPIVFPIGENDVWPTRLSIRLDVWDDDVTGKEHLGTMTTLVEDIEPVRVLQFKGGVLNVYALLSTKCDANYYSYDCTRYCEPQDGPEGHYNCSSEGHRVCHPGWSGDFCDLDIDECASAPCRHGGTCEDEVGGFFCSCPYGYDGDRCEILTDICVTSPCQNGGECESEGLNYTCVCASGFTGEDCEFEFDACNSYPCENGGACNSYGSNFECWCNPDSTGPTCSEKLETHRVLSLRLVSYSNPDGLGDNGRCCDGYSLCTSACDHFFHVCLGHYQEPTSLEDCSIGEMVTGETSNENEIQFGDVIGDTANPMLVDVDEWHLKGFYLKVDVWDVDSTSDNDFVDYFSKFIARIPHANDTLEIRLEGRTSLVAYLSVSCQPGWYGIYCTTYCEDDVIDFKYECSEDGEKLCSPGWYGPDCDVEDEPTHK